MKDLVSKYLLKRIALDIARLLFHLDITEVEILETQTQRVEERRSDMLVKAISAEGDYLLHMDIQNDNQKIMPLRMLRYRTDIMLQYGAMPIRQYLIYIGREPLSMTNGIQELPDLSYQYRLIDMHSMDYRTLLVQNTPDALVLAILCDFKGTPEREVIRYILKQLQELTGENETSFREYLLMLEVLSTNRNLKKIIQEEEAVLSEVKYSDLPSYGLGMRKGRKTGMEAGMRKGHKQGVQEGQQAARYAIARQLLDILDDATIAEKTGLSEQAVAHLRET